MFQIIDGRELFLTPVWSPVYPEASIGLPVDSARAQLVPG